MPEFETDQGRVTIDEVERITRHDGNDVSIMRVRSQRLEALEGVVGFLRDSGVFFPVKDYQEVIDPEMTTEQTGREPRTVYLACPASEAQFDTHQN